MLNSLNSHAVGIGQVLQETLDVLQRRLGREEDAAASGITNLDGFLGGGGRPGDLIVLGARPGMGKTSFALGWAAHVASNGGHVALFSVDMDRAQVGMRMLAARARIGLHIMRSGRLDIDEYRRLAEAAGAVADQPIHVDDRGAITLEEITRECHRLHRGQSLRLVVIDCLQMVTVAGSPNRAAALGAVTRGLKRLARDLGCTVLALSHLNRALERRADKRPNLSDLRESGAVAQNADVVLFLYRDEVYNPDSPDVGMAEVIVRKQRDGPTGMAPVAFIPPFLTFANSADDHWF